MLAGLCMSFNLSLRAISAMPGKKSGAAEKLETMMARVQAPGQNLSPWLLSKSLPTAELWLRGCPEDIDNIFQLVDTNVTIRLAEK